MTTTKPRSWPFMLALLIFSGGTLFAQDETPAIDTGDTAWMLTASIIVLFMTLPGLALFYGGLVRTKNVLSVLVQCFALAGIMSLLWVIYGYSVAATEGNNYFGGFSKLGLKGVDADSVSGSIPETVFIFFQMTFAIITPALIVGAFAERMKFAAVLIFTTIWFTFSYLPIWHMAWAPGLFDGGDEGNWLMAAGTGALDFAGGNVVHINAGIAGLVACILVGKRKGFGATAMHPHNVPMTLIGAAMLWVGWFGFNAGSELAVDGTTGMAALVTQIATATAVVVWMFLEWIISKRPTAVGVATGAVAGLVAITPASGTAGPMGAILIGAVSAIACYFCATKLKSILGYDDSLDVFGVHGVGGIVGAILTGLCAASFMGGAGLEGITAAGQMFVQFKSVVFTIVWSGVVAFIALIVAKVLCGGLRVSESDEQEGLDTTTHGEAGYTN